MSAERVLVTGGAGFIGSHTVDLLLRQDKDVVVLDNLSSGKLSNLDLSHPNLEFVEGDILEYPLVEELLAKCDVVLHLAAIPSVPESIENPIYSFQINTQGFLHVLQAVHKAKWPTRLVYASSAAVYGEINSPPCYDQLPLNGITLSPYALQKIHDEQYADLYTRLFGVQNLSIRYFNVYGPRQDPNSGYSGVINKFINAYLNDEELKIFGTGQQSRDFIWVEDVARANLLAIESNYTGILNIATGIPETLLKLISYIEEIGKKPAKIRYEPDRPGDIKSSYAAVLMAQQYLGFKAEVSLKEGIFKLI